jgi:hypothetical protein
MPAYNPGRGSLTGAVGVLGVVGVPVPALASAPAGTGRSW